jgi:fluoroquinolone transport system permease protein
MVSISAPLFLAIAFRFGLPAADRYLLDGMTFKLANYQVLFPITLLLSVPIMLSMFAAFIILDEQDENVLTYLAITPLTKKGYLIYRLGAPVSISTLLAIVALFLAGYESIISPALGVVILLISFEAPLVALFIAGIAKNKVEGLAIAKVASILLLTPFFYYFVEGSWKYLFGIIPPFWIVAAYDAALANQWNELLYFSILSIVSHLFFIHLLLKRFLG